MFRSLIPATLTLLLAPSIALANDDASASTGSGSPEVAARGASHGQAQRKGDRRNGSGSARRAPSNDRRGGGRDGGDSGGDRDGGRDDRGGDRGDARPQGNGGDRGREGDERATGSMRPGDAGRDMGPGSTIRQAQQERTYTRQISAGNGARSAMDAGERRGGGSAPSNFRASPALTSHGEAKAASNTRHAEAGRGGADHAQAERHGGGRDPHVQAHHTEDMQARATAMAHHREAGVYHHRAEVARHHAAWSSRHARAWYRPAGWFRPYSPYRPVYWYHGVFVYGPYPWWHHHDVVVVHDGGDGGNGGGEAAEQGPRRAVDRARTFAIGVRGGSYLGGYDNGAGYGDAGLGLAARYRPVEAVGLELSWAYHDQTWQTGTERINEPLQASVELFAMPWSRVNPYVLAGVTINQRNVQDSVGPWFVDEDQALWGPHGGLGLEFNVGQKASINLDGRYVGYLNVPENDPTRPGAFQANMGLNFYF